MMEGLRRFLSEPSNRMLALFLAALGLLLIFYAPLSPEDAGRIDDLQEGRNAALDVHFFYSPSCPHCREQHYFNERLVQEYPRIRLVQHSTESPGEVMLMWNMSAEYGVPPQAFNSVPKTFVGKEAFVGFDSPEGMGEEIRAAIARNLGNGTAPEPAKPPVIDVPLLGKMNPAEASLPVLAVALGLVDGFNPCAMWVLVYLIGVALSIGDKRKLWLVVGSFVLASGILYFLFMTAWLNAFLFIGYFRPVMVIVGLFALGGGIISAKEILKNPSAALECKVTGAGGRRKTMDSVGKLVSSPLTLATVGGIIALAFAVNSVEFVCSAALPAVFTQVLALANLDAVQYYAYIALYVLFFMLDDLLIFGLAAMAVSTEWGQKYAGWCKAVGAVLMIALGVMLLFFPNALR